jgi:hypothetical protein
VSSFSKKKVAEVDVLNRMCLALNVPVCDAQVEPRYEVTAEEAVTHCHTFTAAVSQIRC